LTRQWGLTGLRLTVPKQLEYQWVYGIGAVCPQTGDSVALVGPTADTWMMNQFLRELSKHVTRDVHVVMVMDGAAWHRSKSLEKFSNITMIILPPYSPELNPIERVWGYLKKHYLANHIYEDYETILDEVCHAWNHFRSDVERVKSLTCEPWFLHQN
jgi:putative transposase